MKRISSTLPARKNKGFSLLELLVSLVIGLLIISAAFSAYRGASRASQLAEAQNRMNEDAQAALGILSQHIRMAGNNPIQADRTDLTLRNPVENISIRGCQIKFSNISSVDSIEALTCDTGSASPNSIAISYEADTFNTIPASSTPTDCLGNRLSSSSGYYVAKNRFYIGTSNSAPTLYCGGNGNVSGVLGPPQPMVENIEDLQFLYGAVKPAGDTNSSDTVAGYLNASEVSDPAITDPIQIAANWRKVLTVRICVLVRSETLATSDIVSTAYTQCDGNLDATKTDRRLRRAYTTTVTLRNRRL